MLMIDIKFLDEIPTHITRGKHRFLIQELSLI